jgi:hypothetical protein
LRLVRHPESEEFVNPVIATASPITNGLLAVVVIATVHGVPDEIVRLEIVFATVLRGALESTDAAATNVQWDVSGHVMLHVHVWSAAPSVIPSALAAQPGLLLEML